MMTTEAGIDKNIKKYKKWLRHFSERMLEIKDWAEDSRFPHRKVGAYGKLIKNTFKINEKAMIQCREKVKELEYAKARCND
jgi:hypothetical protein